MNSFNLFKNLNSLNCVVEKLVVMSLIFTTFFIPIGTGVMNVFYGLSIFLGLLLLLVPSFSQLVWKYIQAPIFYWGIFFFTALAALGIFGSHDLKTHLHELFKYTPFLLLPLLAAIFSLEKYSKYALSSFNYSATTILIFSYAIYCGFDLKGLLAYLNINITGDVANPTVFRFHITQNFFMALAVCLWAYLAVRAQSLLVNIIYGFLTLAGLINVLFLVQGRTGYLVIFSVLLYVLFRKFKLSHFLVAAVVLFVFIFALYQYAPNFHDRIHLGVQEVQQWQPGVGSNTSMGLRLDFWSTSLNLIQKAPWVGHGLGSFEASYLEQVAGSSIAPTSNPHNQYLLFAVECGLLGLLAYLALNYVFWHFSKRLPLFWRGWVQVILLSYAVGNLFNSFLIDSAERMFFALSLAVAFSHWPICEKENVGAV